MTNLQEQRINLGIQDKIDNLRDRLINLGITPLSMSVSPSVAIVAVLPTENGSIELHYHCYYSYEFVLRDKHYPTLGMALTGAGLLPAMD